MAKLSPKRFSRIDFEKYIETKELMLFYKEKERKLRLELIEKLHGSEHEAGTYNYEKFDHRIKIKMSDTAHFDYKLFLEDEPELTPDEILCINYKPTLDVRRYNQLPDHCTPNLIEYVTYKPAMPVVEIEDLEDFK